jgi:hypothetical protein
MLARVGADFARGVVLPSAYHRLVPRTAGHCSLRVLEFASRFVLVVFGVLA